MDCGLLFVLSGPSGVGKGTVLKRLIEKRGDLVYSVSATTRSPRPGEVDGKNYFFVSEAEFKKGVEEGRWLEWAKVHNHLYGTPREFVEEKLARGQHVILEIDVQGARQVREKCPDGIFVFLTPPDIEELTKRLNKRGTDAPEEKETRLKNARKEMEEKPNYDYVVVNDELERAVDEILEIIKKEERGS